MINPSPITSFQAKYFAYDLTLRRNADGVSRLSQSLFDASVDLNPHQIEAALFALRSPLSKGVLLAKVTVDSAGAYGVRSVDLVETFNYLIGLNGKLFDMQIEKGFLLITGVLPSGEKTLVLWRDVERVDYQALNRLCDKLAINPADSEYEVVYINGDHNIPAVFVSLESEGGIKKELKIRQIEPEFLSLMFDVETL